MMDFKADQAMGFQWSKDERKSEGFRGHKNAENKCRRLVGDLILIAEEIIRQEADNKAKVIEPRIYKSKILARKMQLQQCNNCKEHTFLHESKNRKQTQQDDIKLTSVIKK